MQVWDNFIKSHPNGSPYQLSSWIKTIHQTYSYKPILSVDKDSNGKIAGIIPCFLIKSIFTGRRLVSLPFSDYCCPLFKNVNQEKESLSQIIGEYKRQVRYIEIRNAIQDDIGLVCNDYFKLHVIALSSDPLEVKRNIDKRTIQYSIRKAQKAGVVIKEENTINGIEKFYWLNILTRKKHGVPIQPKQFFINLLENMILNKYGFILLAYFNNKAIAAGLFFKFKETIYYKYNASDPKYLSKKTPNHLLTWYAIENACLENYKFFDFGRTAPDNEGLMRYKEMWGAKTFPLPYYYYPKVKGVASKDEKNTLFRIYTGLWKSLPLIIIKRLGPVIYKHIG